MTLAGPLFGYQEGLRVDKPLASERELAALLKTAFDSASSELYFSVDESSPCFDEKVMDDEMSAAAWSSTSGGPFYDNCSYSTTSEEGSKLASISLSIAHTFPRSGLASIVEETDKNAAAMVAALVEPEMGDYAKELALHDGLVQGTAEEGSHSWNLVRIDGSCTIST